MMKLCIIRFIAGGLLLVTTAFAGKEQRFSSKHFGFARIFSNAKQDPKWHKAKTVSARMWLVRSYALKESVVSDPVSDRYVVTCYGGPIDLVHFLCLAANMCSGTHTHEKRLYQEWVAEGGKENLAGFNYSQPPEAHPDDLPSNAFGALFGLEVKQHQEDPDFDLESAVGKFLKPLIPVPDSIAKEFSHRSIVMGLPKRPSNALRESRYGWFTAMPLMQYRQLNAVAIRKRGKPLCREFDNKTKALAAAGFIVKKYKTRPIIIRRLR